MQLQMSLENAYRVHIFCKEALLDSAVKCAPQEAVQVIAAHKCELGDWLLGEAAKLYQGHPREYQNLLSKYQQFYAIAEIHADIVSKSMHRSLHTELLSSPHLSRASLEIGIAINELKAATENKQGSH